MTEFINDKIEVGTKSEALRLHLTIKCFQKGISLSTSDINTLVELYQTGYSRDFYRNCVAKDYYKSEQTVRNAVARMTIMGILSYRKRGERTINPEYLPKTNSDKLMIQYLVRNRT